MKNITLFYRDASNYKFTPTIEVEDDIAAKFHEGQEDAHITELGLSEKEWESPEYRNGYKWNEDDDHYLVDILEIKEIGE